jgi:hypothetical protein
LNTPGGRFLVFVRAGEKSLHRGWIVPREQRSWDLVVSWYGDVPYEPIGDELVLPQKGGKWDVIAAQLQQHPHLLDGYDYIWFPDDDIETDAASIDRIFALTAAHALTLAQPALTPDSYFYFVHTIVTPSLRLRYTNIVEVMVPCVRVGLVRRMLPHFATSSSGWSLDGIWTRLDPDNYRTSAIIDAVTVRHTRPMGKFLAGRLRQQGVEPKAEARTALRRFGHSSNMRYFPCYGGIDLKGRQVGHFTVWTRMLAAYLRSMPRWREENYRHRFLKMFRFAYRPSRLGQLVDHDR